MSNLSDTTKIVVKVDVSQLDRHADGAVVEIDYYDDDSLITHETKPLGKPVDAHKVAVDRANDVLREHGKVVIYDETDETEGLDVHEDNEFTVEELRG